MSSTAAPPPAAPNRLVAAYGLYYVDNRPFLLRAVEVSYADLPPERWVGRLREASDAGFNAVTAPIRWRWHASHPGHFDFTGATNPGRDLSRFLEAAEEAGLLVLAKPGPSAAQAEASLPDWLTRSIPEALARTSKGEPAMWHGGGVFSIEHPAFLEAARQWYDALAGVIGPFFNHPVVAWQVGDHLAEPFQGATGILDFNPEVAGRYRAYLAARYSSVEEVSQEWRRPLKAFAAAAPPAHDATLGELMDWHRFREEFYASALAALCSLARDAGVPLPLLTAAKDDLLSPEGSALLAVQDAELGFLVGASAATGRGPFALSQAALRFQPFTTETRPLSAWQIELGDNTTTGGNDLEQVRALLAAVAHGCKAYSLAAGPGPRGTNEQLPRLQHLLAEMEEELTASAEVHDAIAYLTYPPYSRPTPMSPSVARLETSWPSLQGLHALLLTCGYNPPYVDLSTTEDEALAEYPLAVFPSRGFCDLEDYGKLVVFTLRGGTLLTFPQVVERQLDGSTFRNTFLWPGRPRADPPASPRRSFGDRLLRLVERVWHGRGAVVPKSRDASTMTGSSPLIDASISLGSEVTPFQLAGEPVLFHNGRVVGYRAQVRGGTSIVMGTDLAASYVSGDYFQHSPAERLSLRRFVVALLGEAAPRHVVPDETLECEIVARLSPDGGCLLFVLNHVAAQAGTVHFPSPDRLNLGAATAVEVLYSARGSQADAVHDGLILRLEAGDCLLLRLR